MVDYVAAGAVHAVAGAGQAEGRHHVVAGVSQGGGHRHDAQLGLVAVLGEAVLADRGQLGSERGVVGDGVLSFAGQLPVPQEPVAARGGQVGQQHLAGGGAVGVHPPAELGEEPEAVRPVQPHSFPMPDT